MSETTTMPQPGEQAPDFKVTMQDGSTLRLQDYRGKKVALYFYPEDDTPGCTIQGCNLRDNHEELIRNGIVVLGLSADSLDSHTAFAQKYNLPFPLLADTDLRISNAYGVYGEKSIFGHKSVGIKRTTFLIDETGKIVHVFKRPNVEDHASEILTRFGILRPGADTFTQAKAG